MAKVVVPGAEVAYTEATAGLNLNHYRTNLLVRVVLYRLAGAVEVGYDDLLVLSGFATAFAYEPQRFGCMYEWPEPPWEVDERFAWATGLAWQGHPRPDDVAAVWTTIRTAVDAGCALDGAWYDDLLFAGYAEADALDDCQVLAMGGWLDEPTWWPLAKLAEWHREFGRLGHVAGPTERRSPAELAPLCLRGMASYATADGRAGLEWLPGARFGLDGLAWYAQDVGDTGKAPESFNRAWVGCHAINRQILGRPAAARYLRRVADVLPGAVRADLLAAAGEYEAAWSAWRDWSRQLGHDSGLAPEEWPVIWGDPARRVAGAEAIRRAAGHEGAAAERLAKVVQQQGW